jgi:transcriptional regulator with XRE-family HTH domain
MESMIPDGQWPRRRPTDVGAAGGDTTLGGRIAAARRDAGLTQRGLADLVGVRLWLIDQWESEARVPPANKLEEVAKATGKPKRWLETGLEQLPRELPNELQPASQSKEARERQEGELGDDDAPAQTALGAVAAEGRDTAAIRASLQESERALRQARAEADALRAELARVRAESASAVNEDGSPDGTRVDSLDGQPAELEAMAQWLTQTVRAAAKREAEGIIAAAREEARRILAGDTGGDHESPADVLDDEIDSDDHEGS